MFLSFDKTGNRIEDDSFFMEAISSYCLKSETTQRFKSIANLSNISALISAYFDDINWAGFYLYDGDKLILGPFQGEPACTVIQIGKGVCGTSAYKQETIIVPDVSKFLGHIACSAKSKSELVVPIVANNKLLGVIDIDSPIINRFSKEDASLIERIAEIVSEFLKDSI